MTMTNQRPSGLKDGSCQTVPPLQTGDRLSREEFERRYEAMPFLKKAELIDGIVYVRAAERIDGALTAYPVADDHQGAPHFDLITWLGLYRIATPGVKGGDNSCLRLELGAEPQPDAYLRILATHGGQARTTSDGYVEHAPELIGEIAATSASIDLGLKLELYRRNGVREYVVWRVLDGAIDWFVREGDVFARLAPDADGIIRSRVFPGLWLDVAAMLRSDMVTVARVAQVGLASSEHAAFVDLLAKRACASTPSN